MNRFRTILAVLLVLLLTGCGVRKEDHQRVINELVQTKRQLRTAAQEISNLKTGEVAELTLTLKRATESIITLTAEIDRLKKQDVYAYAEAGKLLDAGNPPAALLSYQAFIRDYPSSPQVPAARLQMEKIRQSLESQQREAAERAAQEQEEQARQELAERVREGMTAEEWWHILRGQTTDQVKSLLGTPGYTTDEDTRWTYYSRSITPNSGKKEILRVHFRDGVVVATQGEDPDTLYAD